MSHTAADLPRAGARQRAAVPTAPASRRRRRAGARLPRSPLAWLVLGIAVLLAAVVLSPFGLVVVNAFKTQTEYSTDGPLALPRSLDFSSLRTYLSTVHFGQKLMNSLVVSLGVAAGTTVLSLLSAYAIGIGRVRGRVTVLAIVLIANILPQEALIYPLFDGVRLLGASNNLFTLIVILAVLHTSFGTYLLASVLGTFPRALIEAAEVDGASRRRVLWQIVVPVVRPTLVILFIFVFIWSWNDFLIPLLFLTTADAQTVPIALASLQGDKFLNPTMTAAGSLISLIPTLILFLVFQRSLVRGVTVGSVK